MSRYINADEEIRKINEAISINEQGRKEESLASYCLRRVAEALEKAPTADVEEVKHGQYENTAINITLLTQECSICKERGAVGDYCMWCGAKMDKEKEE